eukprot:XP_014042066.1 PREDICTED: Smith-Magenis syndrome chromosomal region candidate gene 8 protein homolog [Salmo salar]
MIGSPDVLAFTNEGDLGGYPEAQDLPEEFSLPLFPPSHPWTSPARFNRDFILVAEFSEQVGPLPVRTIPDDPRVIGSFDLNHFSLRVMSVDYQAVAPGPQPHHQTASPSLRTLPRLAFSEVGRPGVFRQATQCRFESQLRRQGGNKSVGIILDAIS